MQILNFVKSLLPKFGKNRLQEDINICRNELQNTVLPSYESAAKALTELDSKEAREFERQWATFVKTAKKGPLVASIKKQLEGVQPMLAFMDDFAQKEFETEVIVAGMTVLKSTVVRMVELAGFVSTYSLRFLNYLYVLETTHAMGKAGQMGSNLTPGEITLIKSHFMEFCLALNALSRDVKPTEKVLEKIPDILVNKNIDASLRVFGDAQIDPLGVFQVKGFTSNPIYHIGTIIAEAQANRYKRSKELKSILELRLLNLQQVNAKEQDAGTEREIEIIQSRIEALDEKIRKVEESVQ